MKDFINQYCQLAIENKDKILVAIVGGVVGQTKIKQDYSQHSIAAEFYCMEDVIQMRKGFEVLGIETVTYYEENDFIEDYLANGVSQNKTLVVVHFSPNGLYAGRHSLITAFCEKNKIIHTTDIPYLCSFLHDKFGWYKLLKDDFRIPTSFWYDGNLGWLYGQPKENTKIICKLNNEASSIGLGDKNVFDYHPKYDEFIGQLSKDYGQRVIVQEFVSGIEVEVPVLSNREKCIALDPVWLKDEKNENMSNRVLNFTIRNSADYKRINFSTIDKNMAEQMKNTSTLLAQKLGLFGIGRIDFRIDENQNYYLTDISTFPHINYTSSVVHSFGYLGFDQYHYTLAFLVGVSLGRYEYCHNE